MATDPPQTRPLLNPVLALQKEPVPETPAVGGQGEAGIKIGRLEKQRVKLANSVAEVADSLASLPVHGGRIHLLASMFDDSFAPTWTPKGLFNKANGCRLSAPGPGGYLIEAKTSHLAELSRHIRTAHSIEARTAISRVKSLEAFFGSKTIRGHGSKELWGAAEEVEGGRAFVIWFAPFRSNRARTAIIEQALEFEGRQLLIAPQGRSLQRTPAGARPPVVQDAVRSYRNTGFARAFITVPSRQALGEIMGSGISVRIDPARRVEVTSPGIGAEPTPPLPRASDQPIVAVIDGGLTAPSYLPMQAWKAPNLFSDSTADTVHGNRVASVAIHGYAWNNNLHLPELVCRVGTAQAIAKSGAGGGTDLSQLVAYLEAIARAYPDTKVWNLSFNQTAPELDPDIVSYLGHEISRIARTFGLLPIISVGNKGPTNPDGKLCGPADCEAAITVGGRKFDPEGMPAGACDVSLSGPGPDGMLKPDLGWFSRLRMIGGSSHVGSSYSTPLVASLAAHTFAKLKDPSPDLVKALLINRAEREGHCGALGWGTPYHGQLPWQCDAGTVTMVWRARLLPGYAYYWRDIPIPPEMIRAGKLFGSANLTAILNPLVSETGGPNYFSTRLQVALQYSRQAGGTGNLLGSMKEDIEAELSARANLAKWCPVRSHRRDFTKRGGLTFSGSTLRLHARVFTRDLFQYDLSTQSEVGPQEVAFVLTMAGGDPDSGIYNSTAARLGNFVDSAVVDQTVEIRAAV